MKTTDQNLIIKEVGNLLKANDFPELVKDFVSYWTIRKSDLAFGNNLTKQIKNLNQNSWINLIESNHKFRNTYGEELADKLINMIEERNLTMVFNNS